MEAASEKMIQAIEAVVKPISIGTNKALLDVIWAMVTGAFLLSRGAVHGALLLSGCNEEEIRRGGNALRSGSWCIEELITNWRKWVEEETEWKSRAYEGYRAIAVDVVVFPRLKLRGWKAKLYRGTFGKAVKAVGLGLVVEIGEYAGERVALLKKIVRCRNEEGSEQKLQTDLLKQVSERLAENEIFVHDAGVTVKTVQGAKIERYVIRLAKNCVARRNVLPPNAHGNRRYGTLVRPLARQRNGKQIPATKDADLTVTFDHQGQQIQAQCWHDVVGYEDKVADEAQTYDIWVFLTRVTMSHLWLQLMSSSQPKLSSNFTLTAGLLSNFPWPPSKSSVCTVNLCSNSPAVGDSLNWQSWLATCSPISLFNCRPCQLDSGTDSPARPLDVSVATLRGMDALKITNIITEFGQKRRFLNIYPKVVAAHRRKPRIFDPKP